MKPTRKVVAGGLAGAVTTIVIWIVTVASSLEVPPEVAAALTTVVGFGLAYLVPETTQA